MVKVRGPFVFDELSILSRVTEYRVFGLTDNRICMVRNRTKKRQEPTTHPFSQTIMAAANKTVQVLIGLLLAWMWCYISFGYSKWGKPWYRNLARTMHFSDALIGAAFLCTALPILLAGSLSVLFSVVGNHHRRHDQSSDLTSNSIHWIRWPLLWTLLLVALPICSFLVLQNHRHLYKTPFDTDTRWMHVGNSFGLVAMVCLTYILIPVSKQSPILTMLRVPPIVAIQFIHVWAGRIVLVATVTHAIIHTFRWVYFRKLSLLSFYTIPRSCFSSEHSACQHPDLTSCDCRYHIKNVVGIMAVLGFAALALTGLFSVRRSRYAFFYRIHIWAAPLSLLCVMLHYSRGFIFMAPSVLYYMATSIPVWMEQPRAGIRIESIHRIGVNNNKNNNNSRGGVVSITVWSTVDTVQAYRSGQYIKLWDRSISAVGHAFTINRVPGQPQQLRIMVRPLGNFTRQLSEQLTTSSSRIGMRGFLGISQLDNVLRHDVVVLVAGGIGITPYLSLLSDLMDTPSVFPKQVSLHWICRDAELIRYVRQEYFEPLRKRKSAGIELSLIVHKTGTTTDEEEEGEDQDALCVGEDELELVDNEGKEEKGIKFVPFQHSRFSGGNRTMRDNVVGFVVFSVVAWGGLWLLAATSAKHKASTLMRPRFWVIGAYVVIGLVAALLTKCTVWILDWRSVQRYSWAAVRATDDTDEDNDFVKEDDDVVVVVGDDEEGTVTAKDSPNVLAVESKRAAVYEELPGRPDVFHLLDTSLVRDQPYQKLAVFQCGPKSLMEDVRGAIDCLSRSRGSAMGRVPSIALYEEAFEI